jgi:RNA polymerase sigma factor (sigma-70 family)
MTRKITVPEHVRSYLCEIGKYDLLTHDDEKQLGYAIRNGILAENVVFFLAQLRPSQWWLTLATHGQFSLAIIQRGQKAHQKLVTHNLKLVVSIAKTYLKRVDHLEFMDLISEGNLGLSRAASKYDPDTGFKFSTYAVHWIRQVVNRAVFNKDRMVRVPIHIMTASNKMKVAAVRMATKLKRRPNLAELSAYTLAAERMAKQLHHQPTPDEMDAHFDEFEFSAEEIDAQGKRLLDIAGCSSKAQSLDRSIAHKDGEDGTLADFVSDPTAAGPEDFVQDGQMISIANDILATLTPKERKIIKMYYGIGGPVQTFTQIGTEMGMSRARAQQIQKTVLLRLKRRAKQSQPVFV